MTGLDTGSRTVDPTGNPMIDGVLSGSARDGGITYAFPTQPGDYSYSTEPASNFSAVSASQKQEALFFLEQSNGTAADDGFSVEGFTSPPSAPETPRRRRSVLQIDNAIWGNGGAGADRLDGGTSKNIARRWTRSSISRSRSVTAST